jgi:hypothetical protein
MTDRRARLLGPIQTLLIALSLLAGGGSLYVQMASAAADAPIKERVSLLEEQHRADQEIRKDLKERLNRLDDKLDKVLDQIGNWPRELPTVPAVPRQRHLRPPGPG